MTKAQPSPFDALVGARIRRERLKRDMTQEALGAAIGATHVMISKWENGVHRIALATFLDIAEALEMPAAKLLAGLQGETDHATNGKKI